MTFRSMGVTIEAVGARSSGLAAVRRQLGPETEGAEAAPDLRLEFAPSVSSAPSVFVGHDARWDERCLSVRQPGGWLELPFDDFSASPLHIRVDQTTTAIPLVRSIVRLLAVQRGILPIHGAAFQMGTAGVVATGWGGSGKTALLLAGLSGGASAIAAENASVDPVKRVLLPSREAVRLRAHHLRDNPEAASRIGRLATLRLSLADRALSSLAHSRLNRGRLRKLHEAATAANTVDVELTAGTTDASGVGVGNVIFMIESQGNAVDVLPIDRATAAQRMLRLFEEDLTELRRYERRHRFARGEGDASVVAESVDRYGALIGRLASSVSFHELRRPPGTATTILSDVLGKLIEQGANADRSR